jgi:hypothetical protein
MMKTDSTHTRRCFEQIRDDLFRMVLCEEDAASQNDYIPLDHTINTHRMRVLENVAGMLSEVGKVFVPDFDGDRFMTDVGF